MKRDSDNTKEWLPVGYTCDTEIHVLTTVLIQSSTKAVSNEEQYNSNVCATILPPKTEQKTKGSA